MGYTKSVIPATQLADASLERLCISLAGTFDSGDRETEWCVALQPSAIDRLIPVERSKNCGVARSRRILRAAVLYAQRSSAADSTVERVSTDEEETLVVSLRRDGRLVGIIAFTRRAIPFRDQDVREVLPLLPTLRAAIERMDTDPHQALLGVAQRRTPVLCVLRDDLTVTAGTESGLDGVRWGDDGFPHLPPEIERTVREAVVDWGAEPGTCIPKTRRAPDGRAVLRVFPIESIEGTQIGVLFEPVSREAAILRAAERYAFTRREMEVVRLLGDGSPSSAIASLLAIAESTVNEHIGRVLQKTRCNSRMELIALVFGDLDP